MQYFRAISPKWVLRPQKEISCHIFKMAILTKFFDDLINHITREYAGKKMKFFLNVSPLTIAHLLLWPFKVASLYNIVILGKNANSIEASMAIQKGHEIRIFCWHFFISISGNNANPTVGCASGLFGGLNGNSNENGGMTSVTSLGSRISQFRHSMRAGSTNGSNNSTSPGNYVQFL